MKRSTRAEAAKQTVAITERGNYIAPSGRRVDLAESVQTCLAGTRLWTPEELERLRRDLLARPTGSRSATLEVVNESTLAGVTRCSADGAGPVAALNFASAKNPGGGFLNGSQAQEESLARSSALYASQLRAWAFYEGHRGSPSLLYTDAMVVSPDCPVFRNDDGALLETLYPVTFITSAAPNAGAAADTRPHESPLIPETLRRRSEYVLALAAWQGCRSLVLGAWGCGVFRNDPDVVAAAFAGHLVRGAWASHFDRVVFSILDASPTRDTTLPFERALGERVAN